MDKHYLHCSCKSSSFIHDMNNNLVAIIKVKQNRRNRKNPIAVYCLECGKKHTIDELNIKVKYISQTIENYLNEV